MAVALATCGLEACSSSPGGNSGTGGVGSGGTAAGSGGSVATGGSVGSGGSTGTGGTVAPGTGGSLNTGGSSSGGTNGTGGVSSTGGAAGSGAGGGSLGRGGIGGGRGVSTGGTSGGGNSGTGTGGTSSGPCQKGQTKASDVVIMGESFYAIDPQYIQNRIQDDARKAGSLGASDKYRNVAVSGQNMNYIATTEWTAATQGGASPKWIIMDGGGIDCLTGGSTCSTCASTFKTLLGKMGAAGVQEVIYTRYPEPGNPPGSNASLKACLDSTMPGMQTACEGSTSPKCHWVDLRPVWVNGDTTDGLHPTQSGGNHVGDLLWSEMVKECFAQ
ncbi:MAG: SGNH/GDSL hydrolase family protein [Polyangia bacterium]